MSSGPESGVPRCRMSFMRSFRDVILLCRVRIRSLQAFWFFYCCCNSKKEGREKSGSKGGECSKNEQNQKCSMRNNQTNGEQNKTRVRLRLNQTNTQINGKSVMCKCDCVMCCCDSCVKMIVHREKSFKRNVDSLS